MKAYETPARADVVARRDSDTANLRPSRAAAHLGIAEKTLANWRCAGKGPRYARLGRVIVYRLEDLDRFIEASLTSAPENNNTSFRP